jgi:uncharacterized protein (TIGR00297 family)
LLFGFVLGVLIAVLAWRGLALSASGAVAAALVGGLVFGLGGVSWAVLLLAFFISSSCLSRAFARRKAGVNEKFSKGSRRDGGQVLANGGLGALLAITHAIFPSQSWPWLAFAGAMAAVNADTWATELGVLSRALPRRITTGKVVERGASGGISVLGTLAALAGAALIAGLAALFSAGREVTFVLGVIPLAGLLGSLFDSFLGATVQVIYRCPACDKETERHPLHLCGAETVQIRGWRWLNNDGVNFACSLVGAILSVILIR